MIAMPNPAAMLSSANLGANAPTEQPLANFMTTERSREVLQRMGPLSDCTVETSDGVVFHLHKSVLAEAFGVLR